MQEGPMTKAPELDIWSVERHLQANYSKDAFRFSRYTWVWISSIRADRHRRLYKNDHR